MAASGIRVYFSMVRIADGAYVAGLDLSAGGVVQVAKDAGAYANRAGAAPTSIGGGDYFYELDSTELGAKASLVKVVLATYYEVHEVERIGNPAQVSDVTALSATIAAVPAAVFDQLPNPAPVPGSFGEQLARPIATVVASAGNSSSSFKTNIVTPASCKDAWGLFLDGALKDQVHKILLFDSVSQVVTVVNPYTAAPAPGDRFMLINR
jgi:hypothetical protein